jgi:hypothetical protein
MAYQIQQRQKAQAKKLGLTIKSSTNKKKKIDIFKGKDKIGSAGAIGYNDFATYLKSIGKEAANKKRLAYLKRHSKEPKMKDGKRTNSYYADEILWS